MKNQILSLFLCFLAFGKYSSIRINTEKYEAIINDIGRQFIAGLCLSLDGTKLLGIECTKEEESYVKQKQDSSIEHDEHQYVSVSVDPLGTAIGTVMRTYADKPFYSFMGIRFATAGTFEMPELYEEPWGEDFMGGFDATYIRPKCPQLSLIFPVATGDEDCLFLNIYTPQLDELNPTRKYPVMVFIYGGGYSIGDGSLYLPSRLIEEDVIVIVLQYRLGTLGFLYSGTTAAPGNMGLMDQVTALKWVKKYIQYFNGDEENITVFGESAGAASTSYMQFTPQNSAAYNNGTQLLDRIITQSGSAIDIWALDRDYSKSIVLHGEATGCYEEDFTFDDIVSCMRTLSTQEIVNGWNKVASDTISAGELGFYGITPVIQDELLSKLDNETLIKKYIVLPKHPLELLQDGDFLHIDVLSGANRDEGSLIFGAVYTGVLLPNGLETDEHFLKHDALPLLVKSVGINDITGSVSTAFRLAFLPNVEMGNGTQMSGGFVDLTGMLFLKTGSWRLAHLLSRANPENNVFFYSFEFESDDSLFQWLFFGAPDMPIDGGVGHADDLMYLFGLLSSPDDREKQTVKKMSTLWANFAYYSDPTPDSDSDSWESLTSKWLPYSIDQENFLLMQDDFVQSEDFVLRWNHNLL